MPFGSSFSKNVDNVRPVVPQAGVEGFEPPRLSGLESDADSYTALHPILSM